jgi:hypothetical protein
MTMAASGPSPDHGAPIGTGSSDEPAYTLPAEPAQSRAGTPVAAPDSAVPEKGPRSWSRNHEEPELRSEPDLPSDGPDEEGEAMIRELPLQPGLSDPPVQPEPEPTEKK